MRELVRKAAASGRVGSVVSRLLCAFVGGAFRPRTGRSAGRFSRFSSRNLWPAAKARGVSRATFDKAFRGVGARCEDRCADTQAIGIRASDLGLHQRRRSRNRRLTRGRKMVGEWSQTLAAVEQTYGVPREVVLGVWGMETNFGGFTGSIYVVRALSTLAYTGYRGRILQGGTADRLADPGRRPHRPRQDAGILGWRHGPDPVHARRAT